MDLKVIASGSSGNCYLIYNDTECLIVECGVPISRILECLDFNTKKVVGCLSSHAHKDHCLSAGKLQSYGIKIYMSAGTESEVKGLKFKPEIIKAGELVTIGRFKVLPFDTHHDAKEPLGFLISHPEMGVTLFAIDTAYLSHTFDGLTSILVECNHSEDILHSNVANGYLHPKVGKHIRTSHLSLQTCIEALRANDLTRVSNIVLLHMSSTNGNAELFQSEVARATGKTVYVAAKGLKVKLGTIPF